MATATPTDAAAGISLKLAKFFLLYLLFLIFIPLKCITHKRKLLNCNGKKATLLDQEQHSDQTAKTDQTNQKIEGRDPG